MKKIFKKNHIIITVLALLIAVAGYINYADNIKSKAQNKSNQVDGEIASNDAEPDDNSVTDPGTAIFTSTTVSQLIVSAKLEREQIRATNKETLLQIINNENLQDEAKKDAISQMVSITDASEKEAAAELLLEAKGFKNVIVSISGSQVDVVLETEKLTESELAQIEDVVTRKTGYSIDSVTITSVAPKKDETTSSTGTNKENEKETEEAEKGTESESKGEIKEDETKDNKEKEELK